MLGGNVPSQRRFTAIARSSPMPFPVRDPCFSRARCRAASNCAIDRRSPLIITVGVGHNPDPITELAQANDSSRYAVPFRIIPERGQIPEKASEPQSGSFAGSGKEVWHVFQHHPSRSKIANKPGEL
jgi:hypothetical protein